MENQKYNLLSKSWSKKKKRADQTNSTTTPSPGFSAGDYSYHAKNDKIPYLHLE